MEPEHCLELGHGPPLLLIHGSGAGRRFWHPLAEALGDSHRVVAPDLPGYGGRPWTEADASRGAIARDLEEIGTWLFELGEPTHIFGHSYGGVLALCAAECFGDMVRSVGVYEPPAFDLAPAVRKELREARARAAGQGHEAEIALLVDFWHSPGSWALLPASDRMQLLAQGPRIAAELNDILSLDRETPLSTVTQPTLVLIGRRHPKGIAQIAEVLVGSLPDSKAAVIRGAGHLGPAQQSTRVAEQLGAHLAAIEDRQ